MISMDLEFESLVSNENTLFAQDIPSESMNMCCPVLVPQITGAPGAANESSTQSPIVVATVVAAVSAFGPAISNVLKSNLILQISVEAGHTVNEQLAAVAVVKAAFTK